MNNSHNQEETKLPKNIQYSNHMTKSKEKNTKIMFNDSNLNKCNAPDNKNNFSNGNFNNTTNGNCSTNNNTIKKSILISDTDNANYTNQTNNNLDLTNRVNSGKKENKSISNINITSNSNSNNTTNMRKEDSTEEKNKNNNNNNDNNLKNNYDKNHFRNKSENNNNNNINNTQNNLIFTKTFNGKFIEKNYESVNHVLEPFKNIIKIEKRQKIKSISPNLKFINLFEDKASRGSKLKTIDLSDLSKRKLIDNKLMNSVENLKKKVFEGKNESNKEDVNSNKNIIFLNENESEKEKIQIKINSHRIMSSKNFINKNDKDINFKKILNNLHSQSLSKNCDLADKLKPDNLTNNKNKKISKNNILLKNKQALNNFLTQNTSELKTKIELQSDCKADIISEFSDLIEPCEKDTKELINAYAQINYGNKESFHKLFAIVEEIESRLISAFEKILKFLQDENLNDYHILTNEFFLRKICDIIFMALAKEKKVTSHTNRVITQDSVLDKQEKRNIDGENIQEIKEEETKIFDAFWKIKNKAFDLLSVLLDNILAAPLIINEIIDKEKSIILLHRLNSINMDERILAKLIIYRIIAFSVNSRKNFIKFIGYFFNSQIYDNFYYQTFIEKEETPKYFFIDEMLDLLKNLIPIIKKDYSKYHWKEIKQFFLNLIDKDEIFLKIILTSIIKFWPSKHPERIINLVDLIETLLTNYFDNDLKLIKKKDLKRMEVKISRPDSKRSNPSQMKTEDIIKINKQNYKNNDEKNNLDNNFDIKQLEITKLQEENFDYVFYLRKIQHKILISLKDSNFLIADRSMVIFKNEKIIAQFISSKLDSKLIDNLISNIKFHWSQDIKMISNLVIIKIISSFSEILSNLSEENKKIIQAINNINTQNEDIWNIQFNLKAD